MTKKTFKAVKEEPQYKDWETIISNLFYELKSSILSLEGYTTLLSHEYAGKLDRKGKHYLRRIQENLKGVEREVRMLRECVNNIENGD